ncbi:matrix metalloproteinase like mmp-like [Cotesia congregata filamentous virus 1]|uniref:Matrix metalloproteinase like mmp-like n=1 Tax=Cotesia congregata filamentous virus 1 TaxID=3064291 RepID=A0ABC8QJM7_9VIRU|nr:matrix metalloproteinase like mmp-like [Cotesia congregata filamentous virus 1]
MSVAMFFFFFLYSATIYILIWLFLKYKGWFWFYKRVENDEIYQDYVYKKNEFPIAVKLLDKDDARVPSNLTVEQVNESLKNAMLIYNKIFTFDFFTYKGLSTYKHTTTSPKLTFRFERGKHGHTGDFDGAQEPGKKDILAHAALPPQRHVCFDLDNAWTVRLLMSVAVHELGHVLGLLDLSENETTSIMGPNAIAFTEPQQKDVANLKKLYPFLNS